MFSEDIDRRIFRNLIVQYFGINTNKAIIDTITDHRVSIQYRYEKQLIEKLEKFTEMFGEYIDVYWKCFKYERSKSDKPNRILIKMHVISNVDRDLLMGTLKIMGLYDDNI